MTAEAGPLWPARDQAAIVTLQADDNPAGSGWIGLELDTRAGNADCRVRRLRSEGAATKLHRGALFTAQPCVFRWNFDKGESWIVLSGRATVTVDTGEVRELAPRTIASVTAGRSSTWVVHQEIPCGVLGTRMTRMSAARGGG